jgi:eukaryotic-like serine/threonine-protein kinase
MGIVYEANDRERRQRVALKLLQNFSPEALYLFKQEFRTLADVRHRNLVRLHELAVDGDEVFFTMELVLGTDFLSYVRSKVVMPGRGSSEHSTLHINHPDGRRDDAPSRPEPTGPILAPDLDRLRPTLRQLVESIQALHAAGKVHRDIKPSNVLVTNDGRGVLLGSSIGGKRRATDRRTVAYMAPEQAGGDALSTASDWYSVGVMLYEAPLPDALPSRARWGT